MRTLKAQVTALTCNVKRGYPALSSNIASAIEDPLEKQTKLIDADGCICCFLLPWLLGSGGRIFTGGLPHLGGQFNDSHFADKHIQYGSVQHKCLTLDRTVTPPSAGRKGDMDQGAQPAGTRFAG